MRNLRIAFGIAVAITGVSASIWGARYAPWIERQSTAPDPLIRRFREIKAGAARWSGRNSPSDDGDATPLDPALDPRPATADAAPFPKAVASERIFEFGRMGIGEPKTHRFRIENKGQGPLLVAKGPTECKCTIINLSTREVSPGSFADVELAWAPLNADPTFEKSAIIWTNDPKLPEIRFRIAGKVGRAVAVSPTAWNAGIVSEDQVGKAVGNVLSQLHSGFKILSFEPSDPRVQVSCKPMTAGALDRVGMLAGYEFTVHVLNTIPLGRFRSRLRISTSIEPMTPLDVELTAVRPGPIRFLAAANAHWTPETSVLNLGRFRHEVGCKTALTASVYDMKERFRVLDVKSSDGFVKVSVEPISGSGTDPQQVIRFVFEVSAGSPPVNYFTQKPAHVTVKTNHPTLKSIEFDLQFVSL
jgi:hypothetical protein